MVPTEDIDASVDFYENTLGLERSKQWGDMPAWEFETGNLTIAVMQPDRVRAGVQATLDCRSSCTSTTSTRQRPSSSRVA